MSVDRQMDEERAAGTCTGMLLSLEERGNPAICNHTDEPEDKMLSEGSPTQDKYCTTRLMGESKILQVLEAESRTVGAGGLGEGEQEGIPPRAPSLPCTR